MDNKAIYVPKVHSVSANGKSSLQLLDELIDEVKGEIISMYYQHLLATVPNMINSVLSNFSFPKNIYVGIADNIDQLKTRFIAEIEDDEKELLEEIGAEYAELDIKFKFNGKRFIYKNKIDRDGSKELTSNKLRSFIEKKAKEIASDKQFQDHMRAKIGPGSSNFEAVIAEHLTAEHFYKFDKQFKAFIVKAARKKYKHYDQYSKEKQTTIKKNLSIKYFKAFQDAYNNETFTVTSENFGNPDHSVTIDFQVLLINKITSFLVEESLPQLVGVDIAALMWGVRSFIDPIHSENPIKEFLDTIINFLKSDKIEHIQKNAELVRKLVLAVIGEDIKRLNAEVVLRFNSPDNLEIHRVYAATLDAIERNVFSFAKRIIEGKTNIEWHEYLGEALKKADNYYKTYVSEHLVDSITYSSKTQHKTISIKIDDVLSALRNYGRSAAGAFFYTTKIQPLEVENKALNSKKTAKDEAKGQSEQRQSEKKEDSNKAQAKRQKKQSKAQKQQENDQRLSEKIKQNLANLERGKKELINIMRGTINADVPNFFIPTFIFTIGVVQEHNKTRQFIPLDFETTTIMSTGSIPKGALSTHIDYINKTFLKLIGNRSISYNFDDGYENHKHDSEVAFTYKLKEKDFLEKLVDNLSSKIELLPGEKLSKIKIYAISLLAYSTLAICNHCTRAIIVTFNDRGKGSFIDLLTQEINKDGRNMLAYSKGDLKPNGGKRIGIRTSAVVLVDGHYPDQERLVNTCSEIIIDNRKMINAKNFESNTFIELVNPNLLPLSNISQYFAIAASGKFDKKISNEKKGEFVAALKGRNITETRSL